MKPLHGAAVASLVAALFNAGCGPVGSKPDASLDGSVDTAGQAIVKCEGINDCKGQGACDGVRADGGTYGCHGNNDCKGLGWVEVPKAECDAKGGTLKR